MYFEELYKQPPKVSVSSLEEDTPGKCCQKESRRRRKRKRINAGNVPLYLRTRNKNKQPRQGNAAAEPPVRNEQRTTQTNVKIFNNKTMEKELHVTCRCGSEAATFSHPPTIPFIFFCGASR